jgi:IMP dehydrogenase
LDAPLEDDKLSEIVAEGVEATVPYRGEVADVLGKLIGGLRSELTYCGAGSIPELWEKAKFIRVTPAGARESLPHDIEPT